MTNAREEIVAAVMEYIGERWTPTLERSIKLGLPDYERVRKSDHIWLGPGREPEDFVEFDEPDAPLTDSNSYLAPNLSMKRALISEWQGTTLLRRWLWDANGLQLLNLNVFHLEEKDGDFLYEMYDFIISDDLTRIWFTMGSHPMGRNGWGLKVVKGKDGLQLDVDHDAGFMET